MAVAPFSLGVPVAFSVLKSGKGTGPPALLAWEGMIGRLAEFSLGLAPMVVVVHVPWSDTPAVLLPGIGLLSLWWWLLLL